MTDKFIATAGTKEEYSPIEEYQKARDARDARRADLEAMIQDRFMEIKDKFKTAYGAARVKEQANQLEIPCSAATCCQIALAMSQIVGDIWFEYSALDDKVAETDTFLDQFVDDEFCALTDVDWTEMLFELTKLGIIQDIWEAIRKLPEFMLATQPEIDKLLAACEEPADD